MPFFSSKKDFYPLDKSKNHKKIIPTL